MDFALYEKNLKKNEKRNEKFLEIFEVWLNNKNLSQKTIQKHLSNANLYINEFLTYYDITKMEDGIPSISSFLGDWFITKCLWSTPYSIKTTATSIKKFYECMSQTGYVKVQDYQELCSLLKDNMEDFMDSCDKYNNLEDDWW